MKKLSIVPFTTMEYPLLGYLKEKYLIEALVSPKGVAWSGDDISILKNIEPTGYQFTNSLNQSVMNSDVVLITAVSQDNQSLFQYALYALNLAASAGKEILCFLSITPSEQKKIADICIGNGGSCKYMGEIKKYINIDYSDILQLNKVSVPVIMIGEIVPGCDSYDVFVNISLHLRKSGKNVLSISEDPYNELLGFESMPLAAELKPRDQIIRINQNVTYLVHKYHPDVVVIRLPQPIMEFSDSNPYDYGTSAFLISRAVESIGCVLCSPCQTFTPQAWEELNDSITRKLGYTILGVHTSNQCCDLASGSSLSFVRIPIKEVYTELDYLNRNSNLLFFNLYSRQLFLEFCNEIIREYIDLLYGVI